MAQSSSVTFQTLKTWWLNDGAVYIPMGQYFIVVVDLAVVYRSLKAEQSVTRGGYP